MLLLLHLALAVPAHADEVEVGHIKRFGVGIALGYPSSVTVKAFVNPANGVALHVGTTLGTTGLHLRLQFEQRPKVLKRFDWGELGVGWQAGAVVDLLFGQEASRTAIRPGVLVGAHLDVRLLPAPVGLFVEASPVLYPVDLDPRQASAFFPVGFVLAAGARWHF